MKSKILERHCDDLKQHNSFHNGNAKIQYHFNCSEYRKLKEEYNLLQVIGNETNWEQIVKLLLWLNQHLHHKGNYANEDRQDALTLLGLYYDQEEGINCLALSIVLCECYLAVGIPARVVYMMPKEEEDGDNHVVVEVFSSQLEKWIMVDPTYGAYIKNDVGIPLNLIEIRNGFIEDKPIFFSEAINYNGDTHLDFEDIKEYYAKNLFWFRCKSQQAYGAHIVFGNMTELVPLEFDAHEHMIENLKYRIQVYGEFDLFIQWLKYENELENEFLSIDDFYQGHCQ